MEVKVEVYIMYEGSSIIYLYSNSRKLVEEDSDMQDDIYILIKALPGHMFMMMNRNVGHFYRIQQTQGQ
ncbi:hypothetical protein FZW96_00830 [Bacillus sp. BGMRC 2118]|nr:hypothetical protein FZW96_00830 [Bacillus sp. BGMRC 2118]